MAVSEGDVDLDLVRANVAVVGDVDGAVGHAALAHQVEQVRRGWETQRCLCYTFAETVVIELMVLFGRPLSDVCTLVRVPWKVDMRLAVGA